MYVSKYCFVCVCFSICLMQVRSGQVVGGNYEERAARPDRCHQLPSVVSVST